MWLWILVYFTSTFAVLKSTHKLHIGGQDRSFDVYTPDNVTDAYDMNVPLVLSWHGWQDECDVWGGKCPLQGHPNCDWFNEVDSRKFVLVRPCGLSKSWNAGVCCLPSGGPGSNKPPDLEFGREIVEYVKHLYSIDDNRIFSVGFSNGGMMSNALACNGSAPIFRAICAVEGLVAIRPGMADGMKACDSQYGNPSRKVSVLKLQGSGDPAVPEGGDPILRFQSAHDDFAGWGARNKCGTDTAPTVQMDNYKGTAFKDCPPGVNVEMVIKSEIGHLWTINDKWSSTKYCLDFLWRQAELDRKLAREKKKIDGKLTHEKKKLDGELAREKKKQGGHKLSVQRRRKVDV